MNNSLVYFMFFEEREYQTTYVCISYVYEDVAYCELKVRYAQNLSMLKTHPLPS